jgi:hypothetical protein
VIHTDSVTTIEREGNLSQGRFRLLEAECISRLIPIEYLCESFPEWIAHVDSEKVETTRGVGSHQFWNELRVALRLDSIVGCCPLMAPSSFPYASWTGVSPDWAPSSDRVVRSLACSVRRHSCSSLSPAGYDLTRSGSRCREGLPSTSTLSSC